MLTEFAQIVEEIVRGAEALEKALTQGRERLGQIARSLQTQPGVSPAHFDPRILPQPSQPFAPTSTVVNLDVLQEINARALTRALQEGRPPPTTETTAGGEQKRLLEQIERLNPSAEAIARQLTEQRKRPEGRAEAMTRAAASGRVATPRTGPRRRASGLAGRLQDLLWTRRGRVWRWRLERSRSPLRQYIGRSLTQFAERGSARQLFASLRRAPVAMRSAQAMEAAQAAGMSQATLARGAALVGMIGQVGGALGRLAAVLTGPVGAALALVAAIASVTVALVRWAKHLEDSVFTIQRTAESFARVHAGMAGLAAQLAAARLQEQRRVAEGTYLTTRLYTAMAERYRREGEDLRILGTNLMNLGRIAGLAAGEMVKVVTGLKILEQAAGGLNRGLEWILNKIGVQKGKGPQDWWYDWMQRFRDVQIDIPQRQKPPQAFNKRPK
jgi:hypothetical protein